MVNLLTRLASGAFVGAAVGVGPAAAAAVVGAGAAVDKAVADDPQASATSAAAITSVPEITLIYLVQFLASSHLCEIFVPARECAALRQTRHRSLNLLHVTGLFRTGRRRGYPRPGQRPWSGILDRPLWWRAARFLPESISGAVAIHTCPVLDVLTWHITQAMPPFHCSPRRWGQHQLFSSGLQILFQTTFTKWLTRCRWYSTMASAFMHRAGCTVPNFSTVIS